MNAVIATAPTAPPSGSLPLDQIRVGSRHRDAMGDLDALARSIAEVGLLHPIVVTPDAELVAGARRLAACRQLGWASIPVTVVSLDEPVRGEWAENSQRKDFTPSEAVAIGRVLEDIERERAEARRRDGLKQFDSRSGKFPERESGETRDIVGRAVGLSGRTYQRAKAVVAAAERDPESFGPLVEEMDRTGKVSRVYDVVVRATAAAPATPSRSGVDRTRAATAERRERVVAMARQGYREESIADAVGIGVTHVRRVMTDAGVPTLAQKLGKTAALDADRIMEGLVVGAEPSSTAIKALDWAALDRSRLGVWDERLTTAIRALTQLRNKLREVHGE